jgi:hypothetical protein
LIRTRLGGLLACAALAACTTGQADTTPPITPGGPSNNGAVLQMAVGTVNFDGRGVGLNLLETFRDANGYTAIPITSATLSGPPGFRGPKGSKDPGSGKAVVPIGSASDQFLVSSAGTTTTLAGADGFGIGPPSCSCPGINFYPFQPQFPETQSFSFPGGGQPFYGGPPAYPPTTLAASALSALVSIPSSWPQGFYLIGLSRRPPVGRYTLQVGYAQNGASRHVSANATLRSNRRLPQMPPPTLQSDGKGGLIVSVSFPRGVTQVLVDVIDSNVPPSPNATCTTGLGFATLRFTHGGTQRIPDNLGNYGAGGAPTFCKNDLLDVELIGFDYDDFSLGPPGNVQQRPALPARADITYEPAIASE